MSVSYEEIVNGSNAQRRDARCRREWMIHMGIQWGGWLLTGLLLLANIVAVVH